MITEKMEKLTITNFISESTLTNSILHKDNNIKPK